MKAAIVGFGYVGQAMYHIMKNKNDVRIYDKYIDKFSNLDALKGNDIVFICLPTPNLPSGKQDVAAFHELFSILRAEEKKPLVVIKSTILYENIKPFLDDFDIVMNPEFLSKNSSFEDSANQKVVVLGGRIDLSTKVADFYKANTIIDASYEHMSIEEAVKFKYIRNIYGAYKVLFWNWVNEQSGNSRKYASLYEKIPQGEMSQVSADGKPGYGGPCFIKDVMAMHTTHPHELTEFMQAYNARIRKDDC